MAGSISGIDWVSRMPVTGTHIVTAAEVTAAAALINTGKTDAVGFIVQVLRGSLDTGSAKVSMTAGVIKVETNASAYVLTAADVINWIVF